MVGSSWRSWANTATSTGWVAGYMSLPVLAFILPDMRHMEVSVIIKCSVFTDHIIVSYKLEGVAPLMTDPPPTNFTSFPKKKLNTNLVTCDT